MSKITWSDVIASIDLSDKPIRSPKRLSQDEIADIKTKCNPKYDLTILDLICTIEGYQEILRKAKKALYATLLKCSTYCSKGNCLLCCNENCKIHDAVNVYNESDKAIGGKEDV